MMSGLLVSCFYILTAGFLSSLVSLVYLFPRAKYVPSLTRDGTLITGFATLAHPISLRLVWFRERQVWIYMKISLVFSCLVSDLAIFLGAFEPEEITCH